MTAVKKEKKKEYIWKQCINITVVGIHIWAFAVTT